MTLFDPKSIQVLGADSNGNNVLLCTMYVDTIADLPTQNAFAGNVLSMGCRAIVINDNSVHRLNSAGQWVQIVPGNSTYTRAEIDSMMSTKITMQQVYGDAIEIPANSDLNNYNIPGIYYVLVANTSTITNTPYRSTGFRVVVEKNTISGSAIFQTIYPTSRSHLEFFRRVYEGGAWSSWYKFEGVIV